jgi:Transposase IS4
VGRKVCGDIASKNPAIFPELNYSTARGLFPNGLYEQFVISELLDRLAELSNEYSVAKFGDNSNITGSEINTFFAILLSGYNSLTYYELYWSISEDTENRMVKKAMTRNRFRTIKWSFHLARRTGMGKL